MAVVGFDFGTTNSLVSLVEGDRVISFTDEQGLPIPSVVCYEGSKTIVGRDARERLANAGLGVHENIVRSPKTLLGQESVYVGGMQKSPVDIVKDVVAFVKQQTLHLHTRRRADLSIDKAVVTIPVNMQGYRRAALRDAFRMAGISVVQFVQEPLAALYGYFRSGSDCASQLRKYERQLVLVFDWGGGTLDLTLCRVSNGVLLQLANDGSEEVGGDVFDVELRNALVQRVRASRGLDDDVSVQPDAMRRLMHFAERAKIDLSGRPRTRIFVRDFFAGISDQDLDYPLAKEEFEGIVSHLLNKGLARIESLLERSGYSPTSVSLCLATGGMANVPAIRSRLHQLFGPDRVRVSDRSTTLIAEGAAWVAHDSAPLTLAKHVELMLSRNTFMPLIKSGTGMPREGDVAKVSFGMYCADPRDGHAKFQFYAPRKPGSKVLANDPRDPLDVLIIQVDQLARPLRERLELEVRIDDNLILHANAASQIRCDRSAVEIHNLEFALALPSSAQVEPDAIEGMGSTTTNQSPGTLIVRSNIADKQDDAFVPGELLYEHDQSYFDTRRNPPEQQVLEKLYYTPCSICRRVSNDPLCTCSRYLGGGANSADRRSTHTGSV